MALTQKTNGNIALYSTLKQRVKEVLLLGRRQVEEAKVRTYLDAGALMDEHIIRNASRGEIYGKEVIEKLGDDLEISASVLWRCLRFARSFKKILAGRQESFPKHLSWSHYRELIALKDEDSRITFMQRADKGEWSAEELAGKIKLERGETSVKEGQEAQPARVAKLIPKRGALYTYRLIAPDSVHEADDRLWIDLGFQAHRKIPIKQTGFKENDIIESFQKDDDYTIAVSKKTKEELFTYKAFVERVVDADTLIVKIDLGFETRIRQYLRLRGIDAPELSTPEGKKARGFVERELSQVPHIILTSSRSDKYDRYLADVFYKEGEVDLAKVTGKGIFLNQVLLDQGLAKGWKE